MSLQQIASFLHNILKTAFTSYASPPSRRPLPKTQHTATTSGMQFFLQELKLSSENEVK